MKLQTSVEPKRNPCASGMLLMVRQKKTFVGFFAPASTEGGVLYKLTKTAINKLDKVGKHYCQML